MYSIFLVFLTCFFSLALANTSRDNFSFSSIQLGFYKLIIAIFAVFLINPFDGSLSKPLFYFIIFFLVSVAVFKLFNLLKKDNYKFILFVFIVFIYWCFFYSTGNSEIRFHQSPDNHGYAATVGLIYDHFSISYISELFQTVTGLNYSVHLGQKTPLLESVWNIPDTRLRYASDMLFTVGRYGLPVYGAFLSTMDNPLVVFPAFMIALSIIGSMFLAFNMYETTKLFIQKKYPKNYFVPALFVFLFIVFSQFIQIYILEGTQTQLFILVVISFIFLQITRFIMTSNSFNNLFVNVLISTIFLSIVYPNGLFLLFLISLFFISFLIYSKNYKYVVAILSINLLGWLIGFILLGDALLHLIFNFLSGVSGMPYHLGFHHIFDLLFWTHNFKYLQGYVEGSFFNMRASDITSIFYLNFFNFIFFTPIYICLIIFFTKLTKSIFFNNSKFSIKNKLIKYFQIFMNEPFILFSLFSVLLIFISLLKYFDTDTNFHSYIYSRSLVVLLILFLPLNIYCFYYIFKNYVTNFFPFSPLFYLLSLVLSCFQIYSFQVNLQSFKDNSRIFNLLDDKDSYLKLDPRNILLVTQKPDHRVSSLSLVGPVNYLTDNWNPKFHKFYLKGIVNVYDVILEDDSIFFENLGVLDLSNMEINGPISTNEILKLDNFKPHEK